METIYKPERTKIIKGVDIANDAETRSEMEVFSMQYLTESNVQMDKQKTFCDTWDLIYSEIIIMQAIQIQEREFLATFSM